MRWVMAERRRGPKVRGCGGLPFRLTACHLVVYRERPLIGRGLPSPPGPSTPLCITLSKGFKSRTSSRAVDGVDNWGRAPCVDGRGQAGESSTPSSTVGRRQRVAGGGVWVDLWEVVHFSTLVHREAPGLARSAVGERRCGQPVGDPGGGWCLTGGGGTPSARASTGLPSEPTVIHTLIHRVDSGFSGVRGGRWTTCGATGRREASPNEAEPPAGGASRGAREGARRGRRLGTRRYGRPRRENIFCL